MGFICHWGNHNHRLRDVLPHRSPLLQYPPELGPSCSLISSGPLLAAPLSPCWSHELSPARLSPLGNPAQQSLPQLPILTQQSGCGPPLVGPMPPMRDSSPGCHTQSSRPFSTMGATSTTRSVSAAFQDAAGIPSSTVPSLVSTTIGERIPAVSSSWIHPRGHVGPPLAAGPSGSPSPLSQQFATGLKGRSPARPLGRHPSAPGEIQCRQLQSTLASTPSTRFSSTSKAPGQGSMPTPPSEEKRIVPSASVKDYNRSVFTRLGSVFGLRVHF